MARHNLGTVISFEVTRTFKKKQFWLTTLLVPVVLGIVIALVVISNNSTASMVDSQKDAVLTFTYSDASGHIDPTIASAFGGTGAKLSDIDTAIETCGIMIVLVDHDVFKSVPVDERAEKIVYDTRGIWPDQPRPAAKPEPLRLVG